MDTTRVWMICGMVLLASQAWTTQARASDGTLEGLIADYSNTAASVAIKGGEDGKGRRDYLVDVADDLAKDLALGQNSVPVDFCQDACQASAKVQKWLNASAGSPNPILSQDDGDLLLGELNDISISGFCAPLPSAANIVKPLACKGLITPLPMPQPVCIICI